jgi:hypothetical protein
MEIRPSLQNLAIELYLQIFRCVDPRDLLALGEVSRDLSSSNMSRFSPRCSYSCLTCIVLKGTTSHRTVWEEVLKKACDTCSYLEGSYQLQSMEIDELKRTAFGPYLWYKRLTGLARIGGTLHPRCRRVIPTSSIQVESSLDMVHLIPGGRYILTQVAQSISLWDLGSLGGEYSQPKRIGTLEMETGCELQELFKLEIADARTLRFAVRITVGEGGTRYSESRCVNATPQPSRRRILTARPTECGSMKSDISRKTQ